MDDHEYPQEHNAIAPTRRDATDTSIEAAKAASGESRVMFSGKIARALEDESPKGFICQELVDKFGSLHQSVSSVLSTMRRGGQIMDSGERRKSSITNRRQIVWITGSDDEYLAGLHESRICPNCGEDLNA